MSDCGCNCGAESFSISVGQISTDPREQCQGSFNGSFDSVRPVACFVHADWCSHRPTKASIVVGADNYRTPNDSVRVFVEGKPDLSTYVYAEVEAEVTNDFAAVPPKQNLPDGVPRRFASYTAAFGSNNGDFVFSSANKKDDDSYTKSAWPLSTYAAETPVGAGDPPYRPDPFSAHPYAEMPYLVDNKFVGCRLTVRCGYVKDGQDTEVASFMLPHSTHGYEVRYGANNFFGGLSFPDTSISIGCHWDDIANESGDATVVRCGLEVTALGENPYLTQIANAADFGYFTFPFELPRSLFVDDNSDANPKPFDHQRYCGVIAKGVKVESPGRYSPNLGLPAFWEGIESASLSTGGVVLRVTCAADHANVIVDESETEDVSTVPVVAQGVGGPVTAADPYFVRRPDLIERVPNTVANADSWQATHLVRRGSSLAGRNAVHHLHLDFVEASPPRTEPLDSVYAPDLSQSPPGFPVVTLWTGPDWNYPYRTNSLSYLPNQPPNPAGSGPRFYFSQISDQDAFWMTDTEGVQVPPLWFWNCISGAHQLERSVGLRKLFPNSYHIHYVDPRKKFTQPITQPQFKDIEPPGSYGASGFQNFTNTIGPVLVQHWEEHEAKQCPVRKSDYRVAWEVDAFVQMWATTECGESWYLRHPLDIPLADSGMTTESHDAYARRDNSGSGGIFPWPSWSADVGAYINVRARVGLRYKVTRVQGFRKVRQQVNPFEVGGGTGLGGGTTETPQSAASYQATGGVRVAGDHQCDAVWCTEHVSNFSIPLDGDDVKLLSNGSEVTKQLPYGRLLSTGGLDPGPMLYRTVRVRVSKEGP